jgi:predicted component of type VI protein secretion system
VSARRERHALVVQIMEGDLLVREGTFYTSVVSIGSGEDCVLRFADDPKVAPLHAHIFVSEGEAWLLPETLTQVRVNGRTTHSAVLFPGDRVRIGGVEFTASLVRASAELFKNGEDVSEVELEDSPEDGSSPHFPTDLPSDAPRAAESASELPSEILLSTLSLSDLPSDVAPRLLSESGPLTDPPAQVAAAAAMPGPAFSRNAVALCAVEGVQRIVSANPTPLPVLFPDDETTDVPPAALVASLGESADDEPSLSTPVKRSRLPQLGATLLVLVAVVGALAWLGASADDVDELTWEVGVVEVIDTPQ